MDDEGKSVAVICHPHPLYGGSMGNKVVHYTARAIHDTGVPVARFNFRGVGHSEGKFGNAVGEAEDLEAVVSWIRQRHAGRKLLLAGFSFGAYVAASVAERLAANALVSIAPPVGMYSFADIKYTKPWLVVMGDEDEVVSVKEVRQWLLVSGENCETQWMPGAGHFFHGHLPELAGHIRGWITRIMA